MKAYLFLALSLVSIELAGCASAGPTGLNGAAAQPPSDRARVYVYRELHPYDDSLQWTAVSLNSEKIGDAAPGNFFYRDVTPGTYEIEVRSDQLYPNQFKTVTLAPGSIVFAKIQEVKFWGKSFGGGGDTFVVTLVDPTTGYDEIGQLHWMRAPH